MKKSVLWVVLGIMVAGVAGILLKGKSGGDPASSPEEGRPSIEETTASAEEEDSEVLQVETKTDRPRVANAPEEEEPDNRDRRQEAIAQWNEGLKKANEAKAAKLIDKLVADLGLSPAQRVQLEEYFAQKAEEASGMWAEGFDGDDPLAGVKAMALLEGKGLDEIMGEVLTPEQKEEWNKREEKKTQRVADSSALKDLAGLNAVVEIREDQREAVYDYFYQKRLEKEQAPVSEGSALGSMIGSLTQGMGIQIDTDAFEGADFAALTQAANEGGAEVDYRKMMQEQKEARIEAEINDLRPILDEDQLQNYREHKEGQRSILDGFLPGGGGFGGGQ